MENNNNQAFDFNATIEIPESEFVLLDPGTYKFTITNREKSFHQPNPNNPGKMPADTPIVTLFLSIESDKGTAVIRDRFFLHPSVSWRIGAFFKAVGMIPEDSKQLTMDWDNVIGKSGYCTVKQQAGNTEGVVFNNIDKYLKPSQAPVQATTNTNNQFSV